MRSHPVKVIELRKWIERRAERARLAALPALGAAIAGLFTVFISPISAHADDHDRYLEALRIADSSVARKKALRANGAGALSSALLKSLYGRYYQVGDHWQVVAMPVYPAGMRQTAETEMLKDTYGQPGVFAYEVKEVRTGAKPEVIVEVRQVESFGLKPVDPKVSVLRLKMNDELKQSEKSYSFAGSSAVNVPAEGARSRASSLEHYPLDVPEVATADRQTAKSVPQLPGRLAELSTQVGFNPDLASSAWFEQDDFFGRPVQFLWEQGNPWPTYLKTPQGVAILVRSGRN